MLLQFSKIFSFFLILSGIISFILSIYFVNYQPYIFRIFIIISVVFLPINGNFIFYKLHSNKRIKKEDYLLIQTYILILVLFITFFSISFTSSILKEKKETLFNNPNIYQYNFQNYQHAHTQFEEQIEHFESLIKLYPFDFRIVKILNHIKRTAFLVENSNLSETITKHEADIAFYENTKNYNNLVDTYNQYLSIIPKTAEFETIRRKAFINYLNLLDNYNIKTSLDIASLKETYILPLENLKELLKNKEYFELLYKMIPMFSGYSEIDAFFSMYQSAIFKLSQKDFILEGFEERLKMEPPVKTLSNIYYQLDNDYTLFIDHLNFYGLFITAENILLLKNTSPIKTYAYGFIKNSSYFLLKEEKGVKSDSYSSKNIQIYMDLFSIVYAENFIDFISNDIINVIESFSLIKSYNPDNLIYYYMTISIYINFLITNISLFFIFFFFSFNTFRHHFRISTLFSICAILLLTYGIRFYLSLSIYYFSNNFFYFYLFESLINALLLFSSIGLYSSTNPKTKEEKNYETYKSIFKR